MRLVVEIRTVKANESTSTSVTYSVVFSWIVHELEFPSRFQPFKQHLRQHMFIQTEIRDHMFQSAVFLLEPAQPPGIAGQQPVTFFFQSWNVCSEIPILRMTSFTGIPVSACFKSQPIQPSVYADFFISPLVIIRELYSLSIFLSSFRGKDQRPAKKLFQVQRSFSV